MVTRSSHPRGEHSTAQHLGVVSLRLMQLCVSTVLKFIQDGTKQGSVENFMSCFIAYEQFNSK